MTQDVDRAWLATRKGLIEQRRRGPRWAVERASFLGEPVSMVLPPLASGPQRGRMLAALNLGHFGVKLHASDDAGRSWHEAAAPAYPKQPAGAAGPAWKLVQIWSLEAAGATLWAGTIPGGLFRSRDGGESWHLVDTLWNRAERAEWFGGGYDAPGIHSICPHPARAGELLVGISCGGVWVTRDDAKTWSLQAEGMRAAYMPPEQSANPNVQDSHAIVRSAVEPDVLWAQHHNGIFRSTDNAAGWHEITTAPLASFGFAVATDPNHAGTAWFVPGVADERRVPVDAALAVNRTRDGGASFETLRNGLPQTDCYDLVYRHGLAVDASGRGLLMGSTTGNCWASTDAGESWEELAGHLPPIYAARFG